MVQLLATGGDGMCRRRRKSEAGIVGGWPVLAAVAVVVTAAAVIASVVYFGRQTPVPSISADPAIATRDNNDDVVVTLNYTVRYPSVAYVSSQTQNPTLTCTMSQVQTDRTRTYTGMSVVGGGQQIETGRLVIGVPDSDKSISGAFDLTCHLDNYGKTIVTTNLPSFTVPSPGAASSSPPQSGGSLDLTLSGSDNLHATGSGSNEYCLTTMTSNRYPGEAGDFYCGLSGTSDGQTYAISLTIDGQYAGPGTYMGPSDRVLLQLYSTPGDTVSLHYDALAGSGSMTVTINANMTGSISADVTDVNHTGRQGQLTANFSYVAG